MSPSAKKTRLSRRSDVAAPHFASHALPRALTSLLPGLSPIALAFSGGLDSRFLAHTARLLAADGAGPEIHLFHAAGPHVPATESADAQAWAEANGFAFTAVPADPLSLPDVRANTRERCYHCKRLLFSRLADAAREHFSCRATLCDGSNASDFLLFRPGFKALRELGVRSPLAEAALDKAAIRAFAAATGLDDPEQQARPCMLTRFAYGLAPSHEALAAAAEAERNIAGLLRSLFPASIPDFRLRLVGALESLKRTLPYTTELHLSMRPDEATARRLEEAVAEQGFVPPTIVVLDTVSGHYDRQDEKLATRGV